MQGKLTLVGTNRCTAVWCAAVWCTIREVMRALQSGALKLELPSLQKARDIRVTYYDGEFVILRDSRGIIDVLCRRPKANLAARVAPAALVRTQTAKVAKAAPAAEEAPPVESHAEQLLHDVQSLQDTLQAQFVDNKAERRRLQEEIATLERSLESALVDCSADSVKLGVIEKLGRAVFEDTHHHQQQRKSKVQQQMEYGAEVADMRARSVELEEIASRQRAHEESLRAQIAQLQSEFTIGPRDRWAGYRIAISKTRLELHELQGEQHAGRKAAAALRRELSHKIKQHEKKTREAEAETTAHRQLEAQLAEQRRELSQQQAQLSKAVAAEEALRLELHGLRGQLDALDEREAKDRELAACIQGEIDEILSQMSQVEQVAKSRKAKKPRFWKPWR